MAPMLAGSYCPLGRSGCHLDKTSDLEKILDITPFLLTRCSRDLRYLYVSKAYATMLGRPADEVAGKPMLDIVGPEWFETIRPHIEKVLRGERVEYEAAFPFAGVGPRQVHVIYVPERDDRNQVVGWIASIIDITERKETAEDKEQLDKLAAEMGIGTWIWDVRTDSMSWTPEFTAIYGMDAASVRSYTDFRNRIHPDDIGDLEARRDAAIRRREVFHLEGRIIRPDGQIRWVLGVGRALYDKVTGEPIRVIGHSIDITERKESDRLAELHRKELTHLMRVATLGGLSGGIAHELGQPLASILANAQAAQQMLAAKNPDLKGVTEILEEIVQDDVRAGQVISHLRKLLQKGEHREELISLNDLVASTLRLLHSELITNKITVDSQLKTELPPVNGDWVELQQVLINLISNAIEAMASTAPSARRITIVTRETKEGCDEVSIRDRGRGMSPDELEHIFELFFTTKDGGLGLGLSICQTIVMGHGGQLTLSNASDGGVVATISLPKACN